MKLLRLMKIVADAKNPGGKLRRKFAAENFYGKLRRKTVAENFGGKLLRKTSRKTSAEYKIHAPDNMR